MSSDTKLDERLQGCVVHRAGDAGRGQQIAEADPVLTEVIRHGLNSAANQMKRALVRTAFSPIIYEVLDFAVAIYDDRVRLLAQAPSLPMFMGRLSFCVRAAVDAVGGPAVLDPGDVLLYNHPYGTGSHPQDAALVMPVFDAGELIGYAAVKGHWLDIGAKDPYATDTVDMHQEGTIYPGVRLYRRGELVDDIYRLALANSRLPHAVAGDIKAEVVAVRTGAAALSALVSRHGLDTFQACVERIFDHGEAVVRSYFERIPDGSYVGEGVLDNDGLSDELVHFDVAILVEGSEVTVDFSDAPPQRPGPVNCTVPKTVAIARIAIGMLAGGGEAPNEGHYRAISVDHAPRHVVPSRSSLLRASSEAGRRSRRSRLSTAPSHSQALSSSRPAAVATSARSCGGGAARRLVRHGRTARRIPSVRVATSEVTVVAALMHISESATRLTPTEVRETKSPILVSQVELIPDSGGAGRSRGGLGVRYTFNALEDMWITVVVERTKTPPWSLAGGKPGTRNSISLEVAADADQVPLQSDPGASAEGCSARAQHRRWGRLRRTGATPGRGSSRRHPGRLSQRGSRPRRLPARVRAHDVRLERILHTVDAHCEGEASRVVVGGILDVPGATMLARKQHLERHRDELRQQLLFEPRGQSALSAVLLTRPADPDADLGILIMEGADYPPMSGTNTINSVTVALETGIVPMHEPVTELVLDTPGGIVQVSARCHDGKCESVTFDNVPSFSTELDVTIEVPGLGTVGLDVAYGGHFFALVSATDRRLRDRSRRGSAAGGAR